MSSERLPRFRRSPEIAPIRLTERDQQILVQLHRHRCLRSSHIAALLGGSRQQTLRRLQRLFHHGYIERPRCQLDYFHHPGSRSIVYGLASRGASCLRRELDLPFPNADLGERNAVGRPFLDHALAVSDFMVRLELGCRARPSVRLIEPPAQSPGRHESFRWRVDIGRRMKIGVIPDRVFGLQTGDQPPVWFCLEMDRGTMPITRRDPTQSSIQRKLIAYSHTWVQNLHRSKFGWQRFRVLTVTTSLDRVASMQEACHSLERGRGLFLFAAKVAHDDQLDPLAMRWLGCDGATTSLLLD